MNTSEWMIAHGLHKWIVAAETAATVTAERCFECGEEIGPGAAHQDDDGQRPACCPDCSSDLDVCGMCGEGKRDVLRRRRNTQYLHEESNWLTCCKECFDEDWESYEELWADYYSSRF